MNRLTIPVMKTFNKSTNKYETVDVVCFKQLGENEYICQYQNCNARVNGAKHACYMHTGLHHSGCKTKLISLENYLEKMNKKRMERSTYNSAHRSKCKKNCTESSKGICPIHAIYVIFT
jgi:hypothetical protein